MARVTIKTIAQAVGVSAATVSNAYNRPNQLSEDLRQRILDTADQLGYTGPHAAARSLRSGRAGAIGLLMNYRLTYAFSDPFAIGFFYGLSEIVEEHGSALILLPSSSHGGPIDLGTTRAANIDGLTEICHSEIPGLHEFVRRSGIPFVSTYDMGDVDYVAIDDHEAGRLLGQHLHRLGHRRVGMVVDSPREPGAEPQTQADSELCSMWARRAHGLMSEMPGARLTIAASGINCAESGSVAAGNLLDSIDRPTAIVGASDAMALGALRAMTERGLSAPGDVSVCGIDDVPDAALAGLTTVHQPIIERGRMAGRLLFDPTLEPRKVTLPVHLVVRRTTGPARD